MLRRCLHICRLIVLSGLICTGVALIMSAEAHAATDENPQEGAIGVEGKIPSKPPSTAPTITTPRDGQSFTTIPVTVNGLCTSGLLVKLFANNVFVGSVLCEKGSYSLQADLFSGQNDLVAKMFDSLDQGGPDSNIVKATFIDAQFNPFGTSLLSLTSNYAARGANPGQRLIWPVVLSGGANPYAISVDWGDGSSPGLMSSQFTGTLDLSHVYTSAGIYRVTVKATDKNGLSAFLQLVATANGAVTSSADRETNPESAPNVQTKVLWLPAAASIPLIFVSFWLGQRFELATLRKHLERRD
ncbi:MAG TPA: PKD domain-containing protein [Candidatus Saccharimonadales bacterium]|nr:PKD domain-containing protein [Candidatus Saccharimonadales bacterium]